MTNLDIDEVLYRLSIKFNRIILDKDFVQSVNDDLQEVIDDKNGCCVLVFPVLSPNYLKLVKYQAKLCDLAVISLGSGSTKSVGVCLKKYYISNHPEKVSKTPHLPINTDQMMTEIVASTTRKKRPPIQLYVPPAQRKSETPSAQKRKPIKNKSYKGTTTTNFIQLVSSQKLSSDIENTSHIYCTEDLDYLNNNQASKFPSYQCNCAKLLLFKDIFPYAKLLIFSINRIKHSFHWVKMLLADNKIIIEDSAFELIQMYSILKNVIKATSGHQRFGLLTSHSLNFRDSSKIVNEFQDTFGILGHELVLYTRALACDYYYPLITDFNHFDDQLATDNCLHCLANEEERSYNMKKYMDHLALLVPNSLEDLEADVIESFNEPDAHRIPKVNCDNTSIDVCAKSHLLVEEAEPSEIKSLCQQIEQVIVLDDRIEATKIEVKNAPGVEPRIKQNEHEQEKEIMRNAKRNINRKTRPIIKYVDDDNDTLKIDRGDNLNNWEDLFNDEGELQDDVFSEIAQKVGKNVTIVKAVEDYSAYATKQLEELEHMVELYDFPSTLETHDIISAFKEIDSDAMYVKWVDDTHALLVLGSLAQAQKAIELSNSLIKVRPMVAASKSALEKANQFDLKPAMKRPQTNLQTARRLITSHLGAKSRISKEQSAKEREDLRVAKELKRQARQNEKDAWEGSLRSSIN